MKDKMIVTTEIFAVLVVALIAGVTNALPPQKIVGGTEATLGEFPYQISLRVRSQHICGGTIVSNRHIITAAHCVVGSLPYSIRIATGTITSTGGQLHSVSKILSHPKYDRKNSGSPNDIAIITLAANITFDKNQDKLDLPTEPTPSGVKAIATGWGFKSSVIKKINPILLKAELKTLSKTQCQQKLGPPSVIYDHQICTYSAPGLGTCQGDSGGPLAYNDKFIGLVSYGVPCAIGYPDVFTSIFHHLTWINQNMKIK